MNYVTRTIYNLFDLVKDVGGLASGQNGLFLIIMSILQYQDLHYHLVASIYKKESLRESQGEVTEYSLEDQGPLKKSKVSTLRLNFIYFFAKLCPCCIRPTREEKYFLRGLEKYK